MNQQASAAPVTAGILIIGDEILSGRTLDTNSAMIARRLAAHGIDVAEMRVVPDIEAEIVAALNALRARYNYVFTTGGIGPTHDDITADAVARAFGVGIDYHPGALALLTARYGADEFNTMRRRMARVPDGAELVKNSISVAPGFRIGNVFVMAGVPRIAEAMMEEIAPTLTGGTSMLSVTVRAAIPEGRIAGELAAIQTAHPVTQIGSYPFFTEAGPGVELVVRARDPQAMEAAASAIEAMLKAIGAASQRIAAR